MRCILAGRLLLFVLIGILCVRCKEQDGRAEKKAKPVYLVKDSLKSVVKKTFDIDTYEKKLRKNPAYEGYRTPDGTEITEYCQLFPEAAAPDSFNREQVQAYTRIEEFSNGYRVVWQFNNKGNLTALSCFYSTSLGTGKWQQFDDAGKLIGETDKDREYPFTLTQVIAFGKRQGVDFAKTGYLRRGYDSVYKAHVWALRWVVDEQVKEPHQQIYILDGATGRVLKAYREGPPQRIQ